MNLERGIVSLCSRYLSESRVLILAEGLLSSGLQVSAYD